MRIRILCTAAALGLSMLLSELPLYAAPKVNINTASKRRLERLPGVGKDIAALIVAYRKEVGYFRSVSELKDIPGIGDKKLDALKRVATVGPLLEKQL